MSGTPLFTITDHGVFYQKIQGKSASEIREAAICEDENTANAMRAIAKHFTRIANMGSGSPDDISMNDYIALCQQDKNSSLTNADFVRPSSRVKLA